MSQEKTEAAEGGDYHVSFVYKNCHVILDIV